MFASSKPCPGEVRNEMFVYSKKFSSNCDYWRGLLRHVSNVLNREYNTWWWCLLVPTSSNILTNHKWTIKSCLHVKMWMLVCQQNFCRWGWWVAKILQIFCQQRSLQTSKPNSGVNISYMCLGLLRKLTTADCAPAQLDLRHQITITCQCSLLSDQTTFIVHW